MDIPTKYAAIIDDVTSRFLKYGEKGRAPAPTLIKGGIYSGASLITHEIFKKVTAANDKTINIKFLKLRLSESQFSAEIARELTLVGKSSKKTSIFFMDGIDRILNSPAKSLKRGTKTGRSAKTVDIVEESHKMRKILIEYSNKISLVSSSGPNTKFMEDPDLPFYKFFNEIAVSPLSAEDSVKYFFNSIRKSAALDLKSPLITELGEASYEWPYKITGGNWLLLQKFHQVLAVNSKQNASPSTKGNQTVSSLEDYFLQLQPILMMEISNFSREERRFIEGAALLGLTFELKSLSFDQGNPSLIAKQLVEKGILNKSEKAIGIYSFSHIAMRTFIRYFTGANLTDVFSDEQVLK